MQDCTFCRIIAGEAPAEILYQDEHLTAFFDQNPQAPVHVLIVPNKHLENLREAKADDTPLLGELLWRAAELAREQGISSQGYRLVLNVGRQGGQSVPHLHLHLLGGRRLRWPPG